jgi:hypothetical protein
MRATDVLQCGAPRALGFSTGVVLGATINLKRGSKLLVGDS